MLADYPKDYEVEFRSNVSRTTKKGYSTSREMLDILKHDVVDEICFRSPILSLNYASVTCRFLILFESIEDELRRLRNPLWVRAYEKDPLLMKEKRFSLTKLALTNDGEEYNDECLRVMANVFQSPRMGWFQNMYWEDFPEDDQNPAFMKSTISEEEQMAMEVGCSVM